MKYELIEDGKEYVAIQNNFAKHACCDCGLVHKIEFEHKDGTLVLTFWRDKRATQSLRRRMKRLREGLWNRFRGSSNR